ncbi:MFS transporter asaE-like protein [Cladobotryum mycophilum]|uniref:MFS transporter asaE-like protein n=1 Tax=Cladobotryum mycophilum TaxID=491253 RepID=A0ABR0SC51_9HYPO
MSSTQVITTTDIELVPQSQHHYHDASKSPSETENEFQQGTQSQQLKPVDRGRDAWTVLIAGFIFDALFWGFPMCFGVFQNYYSQLPEFKKDSAKIPTIGVLAQALYYLGAPFSAMLTRRFPKYQRLQIWIGCPLCILGLLAASFTSSVNGLIATQGLLYGLGFVTLSFPIVSMINEWWVARKGMAFGLISASSGATGTVLPFILDALLIKYGHRTTLRASAVAMMVLAVPLLPLFKGRLPASDQAVLAPINWGFLKQPLFWIYGSAILVQGIGFFYPVVFLPSYASSLGIRSMQGAVLVALMSIAQVVGQFAFGYLSDKNLSPSLLGIICCVIAAAASFTFWGLAKSLPFLIVFSLIYGVFGFGFATMRVAMGRAVSDDPSTVFATYAIFVFVQGVGNILVGPLSAVLMSSKATARERYAVGKYDSMVILTGVTSCCTALIMLLWHGYRLTAKHLTRW